MSDARRKLHDAARGGQSDSQEAEDRVLAAIPAYPVEALPQRARALVDESGLPDALVGGSVLAALAGAIGGNAEVVAGPTWPERPILWVPLIAPRGAGKSPAQSLALGPLRAHDADLGDDDPSIRIGDLTSEAMARALSKRQGAAVVDQDELSLTLRALGEYKRGGGGDRSRLLERWEGAPWKYERVGGGTDKNKVQLTIARPTLVVVGGLQPPLHVLLGGDDDGFRVRWLPHLAPMPSTAPRQLRDAAVVAAWGKLLEALVEQRERKRKWHLTPDAHDAFDDHQQRWFELAHGRETSATLEGAATKADRHLLRIALVLAEADDPGASNGNAVTAKVVERAAAIVNFTLGCWGALPSHGAPEWLNRREAGLDAGVAALLDWLEAHGGEATRREIQRARVAGARTKPQMDALLEAYEEYFPGHVVEEYGSHGGRPVVVVRAPERRIPTVTTGDTGVRPPRRGDEKPRSRGKSDDAEGDWPTVTTGAGDSGDAAHDGWRPHTEEEYVEAWRRRQQRLGGGT